MARILIVDDSPSQLLGIQRIVEKLGHETITATDGAGASSSPNPGQTGAEASQPAQPVAEPAAPEQPQTETQQAAADEADTGVPLSFVIVLALLVIALGLVVVAVVARRRRLESDEA